MSLVVLVQGVVMDKHPNPSWHSGSFVKHCAINPIPTLHYQAKPFALAINKLQDIGPMIRGVCLSDKVLCPVNRVIQAQ